MPARSVFGAVLFFFAFQSSDHAPQPSESSMVSFPLNGPVMIRGVVRQGQNPHLLFRSRRTGKLLLDATVGEGKVWREPVDASDPSHVNEGLGFFSLHRPGLPDPLIVAVAMRPGGSDCAYESALFGEVDGRLQELTPTLPGHDTRGGMYLTASSAGHPVALTVTSERYQEKDAHYTGSSRMAVDIYSYDASQGRFVDRHHSEVNTDNLEVKGEDLFALFGAFIQC